MSEKKSRETREGKKAGVAACVHLKAKVRIWCQQGCKPVNGYKRSQNVVGSSMKGFFCLDIKSSVERKDGKQ